MNTFPEAIMVICPFCKAQLADSKQGYANHIETFHGENSPYMVRRDIFPKRTSKRTVSEIVKDFEERNKEHFINTESVYTHPEVCGCSVCFNKRLDALLKMQEEGF